MTPEIIAHRGASYLAPENTLSAFRKAMEIGEVEGAMSSLSIAVTGILTVILASVYAHFM